MRRRGCLSLALVSVLGTLGGAALAQDDAPSLEAFLRQQTGSTASAQCHHIADIALPQGRRHVGLIESCPNNGERGQQAWVFVADEPTLSGPIQLQVVSAPFDFAGSRHHVELTQTQSPDRFSIQINYRAGCGGGFDRHRFAMRDDRWVVAGRDSWQADCGSGPEGVGASRQERSANFLTGQVEERDYRHDRLVTRRQHVEAFPRFPLERFDPFDAAYGQR